MQAIKRKFTGLSQREQRLVSIAAVVAIFTGFWFGLWQPLNQSIERSQALITSTSGDLNWLTKQVAKARSLQASGASPKVSFSGSLTQVANSEAKRLGLRVARMQPGNDSLQLWLDTASFDSLLNYLASLEGKGIQISELDLSADDAPGMVKVRRLVLKS